MTTAGSPTTAVFLGALGSTYADPAADADAAGRLDPGLRRSITAIAARLIPGDDHWPSAAVVNPAGHVAAILELAPELRDGVIAVVDATGDGFVSAPPARQDAALRTIEADPALAPSFRALYEWVCEAYYRHPAVAVVTRERTGFDLQRPLIGTPMAPFDESRLDRVRALPPRYREVPA